MGEIAKIRADTKLSRRERERKVQNAINTKYQEINFPELFTASGSLRKSEGKKKKRKLSMPKLKIPTRRRLPAKIDYSKRQANFRNDYGKLKQEAKDAVAEEIARIRASAERKVQNAINTKFQEINFPELFTASDTENQTAGPPRKSKGGKKKNKLRTRPRYITLRMPKSPSPENPGRRRLVEMAYYGFIAVLLSLMCLLAAAIYMIYRQHDAKPHHLARIDSHRVRV